MQDSRLALATTFIMSQEIDRLEKFKTHAQDLFDQQKSDFDCYYHFADTESDSSEDSWYFVGINEPVCIVVSKERQGFWKYIEANEMAKYCQQVEMLGFNDRRLLKAVGLLSLQYILYICQQLIFAVIMQ